jgi:hypothetical protein
MITCAITTKRMDNGTQPRTSGRRVQIWVSLAAIYEDKVVKLYQRVPGRSA